MTVKILVGDCRERLKEFPDNHFHCCVTSPPYWGLRDYGIPPTIWGGDPECEHEWGDCLSGRRRDHQRLDKLGKRLGCGGGLKVSAANHSCDSSGQFCQLCGAWLGSFGLEPTPELYIQHGVEISREVRRALREDGTMWLNLGDSYNAGTSADRKPGYGKHGYWTNPNIAKRCNASSLKPKDLVGIPWRVALALQADGWWLRSAIIWHKPNCMPESVMDRPTTDYEFVFLLAKSEQYFYDADAIREPKAESTQRDLRTSANCKRRHKRGYPSHGSPNDGGTNLGGPNGDRNKRTVWTIPTYPFPEAHFATFPPALVEPCIKAGTSERGACPECGAPWERVVEKGHIPDEAYLDRPKMQPRNTSDTSWLKIPGARRHLIEHGRTLGWRPTCSCYDDRYRQFPRARSARKRWQQDMADRWWPRVRQRPGKGDWPTVPCRVLDPLGGGGTTGMVADRLGRDAVLIDIKPEYCEMSHERIVQDAGPMFAQVELDRLTGSEKPHNGTKGSL